jgi:hypothetical protein
MGFGSGGSGSGSIAGSNDVALNNPTNLEVLSYSASTSKWINAAGVTQAALDEKAPLASPAFIGTPTGITKAHVGLANVDNTADADKPVSSATQTALTAKQDVSAKGQANGYASLDGSSLVPRSQLGTGTADATSVLLGNGTWTALPSSPVQSVAGKTGTVTLVKGDVGLANVDNTSDAAKPISSATQTALNAKAATAHVHSGADITSGTIDVARLPAPTAATDTASGVVELATLAEVATGTDTARAVTPAGVKSAITAAIPTVVFVNTLSNIPPGTPVDTLVVVRAA